MNSPSQHPNEAPTTSLTPQEQGTEQSSEPDEPLSLSPQHYLQPSHGTAWNSLSDTAETQPFQQATTISARDDKPSDLDSDPRETYSGLLNVQQTTPPSTSKYNLVTPAHELLSNTNPRERTAGDGDVEGPQKDKPCSSVARTHSRPERRCS